MSKTVHFPRLLKGVKCPTCRSEVIAMYVQESLFGALFPPRKYLLPCQHEIDTAQEDALVQDILKHGL